MDVNVEDVNPAHAGMIPITLYRTLRPGRKPRACGDDPETPAGVPEHGRVNPAHAGMIPRIPCSTRWTVRKPRACGDDP